VNEGTWAAVGLAAVTMLTNTSAALLSYLEKRTSVKDKLVYDTKLAVLEAKQADCLKRDEAQTIERVECRKQIAELHALVLGKRDKGD
jgi:hypothetical protein